MQVLGPEMFLPGPGFRLDFPHTHCSIILFPISGTFSLNPGIRVCQNMWNYREISPGYFRNTPSKYAYLDNTYTTSFVY